MTERHDKPEDRQPGLGGDRRHREATPAVTRDQRSFAASIDALAVAAHGADGRRARRPARAARPALCHRPTRSVRQFARPRRRGGDRAVEQFGQPGCPINTSSAARVVPPGLVTFSRSRAGGSRDSRASSPAPATVARASRSASSAAARRGAGRGQRLDQQKDISRAAARYRRHGVDQRLVLDPGAFPDRREQRVAQRALLKRQRADWGRRR